MNQLEVLSAAKTAVLKAKTVVEINRIVKVAEAVQAVADTEETKNAADELYFRARRRRGEIVEAQDKQHGSRGIGVSGVVKLDSTPPTLAEQGLDKREVSVDYKLNRIPEAKFEEFLADKENRSMSTAIKISKGGAHVSHNSGNNEWYTPEAIIEAARSVLVEIDLDPASTAIANKKLKAKRFYSAENDGLKKKWTGHVWMNPPYASELIESFIDKFLEHYANGDIEEGIILVNNATDTKWFQKMFKHLSAICFHAGRIRFWNETTEAGAPLQGQAICYFGKRAKTFGDTFSQFGGVLYVRAR